MLTTSVAWSIPSPKLKNGIAPAEATVSNLIRGSWTGRVWFLVLQRISSQRSSSWWEKERMKRCKYGNLLLQSESNFKKEKDVYLSIGRCIPRIWFRLLQTPIGPWKAETLKFPVESSRIIESLSATVFSPFNGIHRRISKMLRIHPSIHSQLEPGKDRRLDRDILGLCSLSRPWKQECCSIYRFEKWPYLDLKWWLRGEEGKWMKFLKESY